VGTQEKFVISKNSDNTYSIQTVHGTYVRAESGDEAFVNQQTYIGAWEKWHFDSNSDGTFCIRNDYWDNYISIRDTNTVLTKTECYEWEKFYITVQEAMSVSISFDATIAYRPYSLNSNGLITVNGCSGYTCGIVNYNAQISRRFNFTQSSGIPLVSSTSVSMPNIYINSIYYDVDDNEYYFVMGQGGTQYLSQYGDVSWTESHSGSQGGNCAN
jgi:hypothetical protein